MTDIDSRIAGIAMPPETFQIPERYIPGEFFMIEIFGIDVNQIPSEVLEASGLYLFALTREFLLSTQNEIKKIEKDSREINLRALEEAANIYRRFQEDPNLNFIPSSLIYQFARRPRILDVLQQRQMVMAAFINLLDLSEDEIKKITNANYGGIQNTKNTANQFIRSIILGYYKSIYKNDVDIHEQILILKPEINKQLTDYLLAVILQYSNNDTFQILAARRLILRWMDTHDTDPNSEILHTTLLSRFDFTALPNVRAILNNIGSDAGKPATAMDLFYDSHTRNIFNIAIAQAIQKDLLMLLFGLQNSSHS